MNPGGGLLLVLAAGAIALPAEAGAWPQRKGKGQVILKFEDMRAAEGFDPAGDLAPLPAERRDRVLGVFAEYGLTDRATLVVKGDWQSGEDAFVDYEGRGPLEVGVNWALWRDDRTTVALYGATPAMRRRAVQRHRRGALRRRLDGAGAGLRRAGRRRRAALALDGGLRRPAVRRLEPAGRLARDGERPRNAAFLRSGDRPLAAVLTPRSAANLRSYICDHGGDGNRNRIRYMNLSCAAGGSR